MKNFDPIFFTTPSGDIKRARTLHKGGGGGDGGAAERKAAEDARVTAAIQQINQIFGTNGTNKNSADNREQLYTKIGSDATNTALVDLNKERGITERDLGFMLARAGLSGGSRDIDVNRDILDTNQQGILKASNLGLSVKNNARSADDKTRVNLIDSVRAGLDAGSALQQSYEGMANNSRLAQDEANKSNLVGFFDTLKAQQQAAAYRDGVGATVDPNYKSPYKSTITSGDRGTTRSY